MHAPHELTTSEVIRWWSWEPITIALLAISAILYAIGTMRMGLRSAAACRRLESGAKAPHSKGWKPLAFAAGWLALVIALISPLDALGAILFSAHMAQHEM